MRLQRTLMSVVAGTLVLSGAANGQEPAQARIATVVPQGGPPRIVAAGVETKITPNRPYAAEAVTESVQVLADGNRISRSSMTKIWRDTAGRTRRESYGRSSAPETITISDPVARASYTLHPARKVAYRGGGPVMVAQGGTASEPLRVFQRATPRDATAAAPSLPRAQAPVETPAQTPPQVVLPARPARTAESEHAKKEDLGVQNIEGVLARGTRTTTTIPAGQIGNAQEIRIVSEQWFSDELEVLVMTRHSDPRSGETTYRLRNILRAEPDATLFAVPSDYTVEQRRIRRP